MKQVYKLEIWIGIISHHSSQLLSPVFFWSVVCLFLLFSFPSVFVFLLFFFLEGFGLDPPPFVNIFPFFNKIPRVWWHRMTVSRGANLIEMSMMSLDVCHFSLLIKKNVTLFFFFLFC